MADAPKLQGSDTLRQAYPKLNQSIENANEALRKSISAENNSTNAVTTANVAKNTVDQTRAELNNIIREQTAGGDVVPEVVQARGSKLTMGERLNDVDARLVENLNKQFQLKSINGFGILEQNIENKVSEHIAEHGYYWFVDRIITNFSNKLIDDLRINGKSLYRATNGALSTTWTEGCTIVHLDINGLTVSIKNGENTVKAISYSNSVKLKGLAGIGDQYLKDKIIRKIGSINVNEKTYGQSDVLFQDTFNVILRIESDIDLLNPKYMVQGIKDRGTATSGEGVFWSNTYNCLAIALSTSGKLYGLSGATLVDRANNFFQTNVITVLFNKKTRTIEQNNVNFPSFYFSGDLNISHNNSSFDPIVEAKVVCMRSELKDFILNKNGVKYNGQLKCINAQLTNSKGKPIQLRGIGTHHLLQYKTLHTFEAVKTLKHYGIDILRLTAYVTDRDYIKTTPSLGTGYINAVTETRVQMDTLISYCKQLDMYCIVDWHTFADENILSYVQQAKSFFNYFAQKYPNDPYILWELTNEPFYETNENMASFIAQVAPEVLATNPNGILLTGVNESSLVSLYNTIQNAISLPNLFLSKHWYVGMYLANGYNAGKSNIDANIDSVVAAKLPFFVTEWGNSMPSGDGARFDEMAEYFVRKLKNNGISWCTWKLTHQDMTTSLLKHSGDREYLKNGGWVGSDFSEYGKITLTYFTDK